MLDGSKEESFKKEISASALGTHLISLTVQAFPKVYGFFKTHGVLSLFGFTKSTTALPSGLKI